MEIILVMVYKSKFLLFSAWIFSAWLCCVSYSATVILQWDPPTDTVIGTPITNALAYKLYYGDKSKTYNKTINVGSFLQTTVTNDFTTSKYFAVTAYNVGSTNEESAFSDELKIGPIFPIYPYKYFEGTEFILSTNKILLSWSIITNATNYKIYGVWNDTTPSTIYYYGSTNETYYYVIMNRSGHFNYYVDVLKGTNLLKTLKSNYTNSNFFVYGYTNKTPWRIYWKLPSPSGIIVD